MTYLLLMRENPQIAVTIPPPALMEMVEATGHVLEEGRLSGRLKEAAFFADDHGGVIMFDADTPNQLMETIDSVPARLFCSVEVIPLASPAEWRESFSKLKAQRLELFAKISPTQ